MEHLSNPTPFNQLLLFFLYPVNLLCNRISINNLYKGKNTQYCGLVIKITKFNIL
jgi:hypothetical protein